MDPVKILGGMFHWGVGGHMPPPRTAYEYKYCVNKCTVIKSVAPLIELYKLLWFDFVEFLLCKYFFSHCAIVLAAWRV